MTPESAGFSAQSLPPLIVGAVSFVILIFGATGAYIALRKKGQPDTDHENPARRYYFDGPLNKCIDCLEGIYREIKELRREFGESERDTRERHKEHMETMRDLADRLPPRRR